MTRRERIEARLERRRQWAASRAAGAASAFTAARHCLDGIEPGQPILVGHHSERRHRRALERHDNAMRRAIESEDMAERHSSVAETLEYNLDRSIYSDDVDAIAQLEARIAEREADAAHRKLVNKAHAKFLKTGQVDASLSEADQALIRNYKPEFSWLPHPHAPFELSNLRGRITADKKRLKVIKWNLEKRRAAQNSRAGVVFTASGSYCSITFAEKPSREILQSLREANFRWGGCSWSGKIADIPQCVKEMVQKPKEPAICEDVHSMVQGGGSGFVTTHTVERSATE